MVGFSCIWDPENLREITPAPPLPQILKTLRCVTTCAAAAISIDKFCHLLLTFSVFLTPLITYLVQSGRPKAIDFGQTKKNIFFRLVTDADRDHDLDSS